MHLTQNSQVIGVDGHTLTLGFTNAGARDSFVSAGCDEILRQAAIDVAGVDWTVEAIIDPSASGGRSSAAPPATKTDPAPAPQAAAPPSSEPADPPDWASDPGGPAGSHGPQSAARPDAANEPPTAPTAETSESGDPDSHAHPDDPDAENSELAGAELLERELGAEVIEEIRHS